MLSDDELDFDNFSDLGDYDGEINADELEKEIEEELNGTITTITTTTETADKEPSSEATKVKADQEITEKKEEVVDKEHVTEEKKDVEQPADDRKEKAVTGVEEEVYSGDLEKPEEIKEEDKKEEKADVKEEEKKKDDKTEEKKKKDVEDAKEDGEKSKDDDDINKSPEKPAMQQHQPKYPNNYHYNNNKGYNNYNYYGYPNQNFIPPPMPFVPFHSNKIYVNPKFNKGAANQFNPAMQQQLHFQQMMMQQYQYQQQLMDVEQKRQAAVEMIRKREEGSKPQEKRSSSNERQEDSQRREARHHHPQDERRTKREDDARRLPSAGVKRERNRDDDNEDTTRHYDNQRQVRQRVDRNTPIVSIRGAAARLNSPSSPVPPRDIQSRITMPASKNNDITSRLGRSSSNTTTTTTTTTKDRPRRSPSPTLRSSPIVPIATNGKTNALTVKGLADEAELKKMARSVSGASEITDLNADTKTATIRFENIEAAVTFRRKYNRLHVGDSHLNIVFKK